MAPPQHLTHTGFVSGAAPGPAQGTQAGGQVGQTPPLPQLPGDGRAAGGCCRKKPHLRPPLRPRPGPQLPRAGPAPGVELLRARLPKAGAHPDSETVVGTRPRHISPGTDRERRSASPGVFRWVEERSLCNVRSAGGGGLFSNTRRASDSPHGRGAARPSCWVLPSPPSPGLCRAGQTPPLAEHCLRLRGSYTPVATENAGHPSELEFQITHWGFLL